MAEFACAHALHNAGNQFGFIASGDFSSHSHAHRLAEGVRAAFGDHAHNVALGEDASDAAIRTENEHRADALFGEKLCCGRETDARFDSDDLTALGRENIADRL